MPVQAWTTLAPSLVAIMAQFALHRGFASVLAKVAEEYGYEVPNSKPGLERFRVDRGRKVLGLVAVAADISAVAVAAAGMFLVLASWAYAWTWWQGFANEDGVGPSVALLVTGSFMAWLASTVLIVWRPHQWSIVVVGGFSVYAIGMVLLPVFIALGQ